MSFQYSVDCISEIYALLRHSGEGKGKLHQYYGVFLKRQIVDINAWSRFCEFG